MTSRQKRKADAEAAGEETVEAVALLRKPGVLGHSLVRLELPLSVLEAHAVEASPPEMRAIVAARVSEWVGRQP